MRRLLSSLALVLALIGTFTVTAQDASFTLIADGTSTNGLSTPGAPTVTATGTTGATTWTYKIVAYKSDGSRTPVGAAGSTATGNATLDVTNYNALTWTAVTGASSYYVYRTAAGGTPSTTGYVATTTARVAELAGVTRGAHLHHFGTRQALLDYGWPGRALDLDRTAVILGNAMAGEKHYLTALRILSGDASTARIPVMALSANAMPRDVDPAVGGLDGVELLPAADRRRLERAIAQAARRARRRGPTLASITVEGNACTDGPPSMARSMSDTAGPSCARIAPSPCVGTPLLLTLALVAVMGLPNASSMPRQSG